MMHEMCRRIWFFSLSLTLTYDTCQKPLNCSKNLWNADWRPCPHVSCIRTIFSTMTVQTYQGMHSYCSLRSVQAARWTRGRCRLHEHSGTIEERKLVLNSWIGMHEKKLVTVIHDHCRNDRFQYIVLKNSVYGRSLKFSASMRSFILSDMRAHIKLLTNRLRAARSLTHENCTVVPKIIPWS